MQVNACNLDIFSGFSYILSGIVTSTVTNPIWVIKTRLQLQGKQRVYKNSLDCSLKILQQEGVKGFYKGMSASYLGVAEGTIQWVIYENLKKRWAPVKQENQTTIGGKSIQGKLLSNLT